MMRPGIAKRLCTLAIELSLMSDRLIIHLDHIVTFHIHCFSLMCVQNLLHSKVHHVSALTYSCDDFSSFSKLKELSVQDAF